MDVAECRFALVDAVLHHTDQVLQERGWTAEFPAPAEGGRCLGLSRFARLFETMEGDVGRLPGGLVTPGYFSQGFRGASCVKDVVDDLKGQADR